MDSPDWSEIVDYAVSRGFKREIVESMSEQQLIQCLERLEAVDDDAVH